MKKNNEYFTDFTSVVSYLISVDSLSEEQAKEIENWLEPLDMSGFDEKECMDILYRWQVLNGKTFPWDTQEEAEAFGADNPYFGKRVTLSEEEEELYRKWWTAREQAAEERTGIQNGKALEVFHRARDVFRLINAKAPVVVLKKHQEKLSKVYPG